VSVSGAAPAETTAHEYVNRHATLKYWYRAGTEDKWVIFLPGASGNHTSFDGQLGAFDRSYNLLLCDLRAQGASTIEPGHRVDFDDIVDDVLHLYRLHAASSATLVAHSYGAFVAEEVALRHPEKVDRLILIGGYLQHRRMPLWERAKFWGRAFQLFARPWGATVRQAGRTTEDAGVQKRVEGRMSSTSKDVYWQLAITAYRRRRYVPYTDPVPTLLISGEHELDARLLKKVYADLCAKNPRCRSVLIPATGHLCHAEAPGVVNGLIGEFMNEPYGPRAS
jgi:pimeloyl-ACP methyl ester carboxylesterase